MQLYDTHAYLSRSIHRNKLHVEQLEERDIFMHHISVMELAAVTDIMPLFPLYRS